MENNMDSTKISDDCVRCACNLERNNDVVSSINPSSETGLVDEPWKTLQDPELKAELADQTTEQWLMERQRVYSIPSLPSSSIETLSGPCAGRMRKFPCAIVNIMIFGIGLGSVIWFFHCAIYKCSSANIYEENLTGYHH